MIDSVIVSYDNSSNNEPILIVGRKRMNQSVEIINAFSGKDAINIYNSLITVKPLKGDDDGK